MKPELFYPLLNPRITTQNFGETRFFDYGLLGHPGIDMVGVYGQPIRCAHDGTVTSNRLDDGRGWMTEVRHGTEPSFETQYCHMREASRFKVGDKALCGDVIGYCGLTGRTTGSQLHFELHKDGIPIDPAPYWNGMSAEDYLSISNQIKVLAGKVASLIKIWVSRK